MQNLNIILVCEKVWVAYGHPPSRSCGGPMGPLGSLSYFPPGGTFSKMLWQVYECRDPKGPPALCRSEKEGGRRPPEPSCSYKKEVNFIIVSMRGVSGNFRNQNDIQFFFI